MLEAITSLESGKAAYRRHDELMDELEPKLRRRGVRLADGRLIRLTDKWKGETKLFVGRYSRRYELEVIEE